MPRCGVGDPTCDVVSLKRQRPETRAVYEKLIARKRSVRIHRVTDDGPWFDCRFRQMDGSWVWHSLLIMASDRNWNFVRTSRLREMLATRYSMLPR